MKVVKITEQDLSSLDRLDEKTRGSFIDELIVPRVLTKAEFSIVSPSLFQGNIQVGKIIIKDE